jgi:hypothetical protein
MQVGRLDGCFPCAFVPEKLYLLTLSPIKSHAINMRLSSITEPAQYQTRAILHSVLLFAALFFIGLPARGSAAATNQPDIKSPDKKLLILILPSRIELIESGTSKTLSHIDLPAPHRLVGKTLWSADSRAVAFQLTFSDTDSRVLFFMEDNAKVFKQGDATAFSRNLGKIGKPFSHWAKISNEPIEWIDHGSIPGARLVKVQTRCWDKNNKRYTVENRIYIGPDAQPMQQ